MRILDLYCGMGGLSLGFALAFQNVEILGLDIDRDTVRTYNFNLKRYNCRAEVKDVTKWNPRGEFDIVIGGPPCQPFSVANTRRRGEKHPLFPTFPKFFDIVLEMRPLAFLFENVKGLVSSAFKSLFDKQISRIADLYAIKYTIIDTANYGVPQHRERLFVLGIRRDLGIVPSFPKPTHSKHKFISIDGKKQHKWVTLAEAIGDLIFTPLDNFSEHILLGDPKNTWECEWGQRVMDLNSPSYTITEKHRCGQLIKITEHEIRTSNAKFSETSLNKHKPQDLSSPSKTIRANFYKVPPDAFVKFDNEVVRRLTVRECMRLQSFPDWWRFPHGISLTKKYKMVGEAVPPIMAYRLAVHISKLLKIPAREPPKREDFDFPYFERAFADYF